ncbi:MAG: class I SAM-dependent methyltransferase [Burkholderiales bacterium]|nr:class I SAM-dependent methyltransferase [Burkholderiales bacterium]
METSTDLPAAPAGGAAAAAPPPGSACLVCGSTSRAQRFVQRGYPVYRCLGCGLQFVWPTPTAQELSDHYARNYAVSLERYAAARERNIARIAELERWRPERGRLLEVGAAYGHSLALARDMGWDVAGVELSGAAAAYAREHFGLEVFGSDLGEAPLEPGSFDAAILWHVLEHSRDPKAQILRLASLLRPGGVLGIRVPNAESFGSRVAGVWWPWMCPPTHLWFFSRSTLPRLLRDCGFEVVEVRTQRGDGNNLYQYTLMWAGHALNELRLRLRTRGQGGAVPAPAPLPAGERAEAALAGTAARPEAPAAADAAAPRAADRGAPTSSGLLQRWLDLLQRAQPLTNALARHTRFALEPIERRGWGDELLVYARRRP